ncbi:MAG: elongation factor Ts [Crocinitomicaceae bacterium]|nr:elongation factor Ts [Crocinitomicaceae bacterium]|tara:strand:- start:37745 stop:38569 length:825 start_codon:yes stop_codon:yes gene_type:complete
MAITASDVNKLRKQTGAGMMDCKNALVETNGDFESAVDVLRKKGQKVAAKRGDNEAKEGVIFAEVQQGVGYILQLNCETDFVAKNPDFQSMVKSIMQVAMDKEVSSLEDLMQISYNDKLTISEKLTEQIGVIGEKLEISNFAKVEGPTVVSYNHPGNQLATIVALNNSSDIAADVGKQIAMQVAAMNPIALTKEGIDDAIISRELEIGKELAIQEGKPAEMAEKIAQGRLGKFFKENTLLSQSFIKDNKITVEQFLNTSDSGLTVIEFKRFCLN